MYAAAKIPFKLILRSLKPIFPIIVFTAVLNLFFVTGEGDPGEDLVLTIYAEGVRYAVLMAACHGADRRYQPSDLYHQPHRAYRCH